MQPPVSECVLEPRRAASEQAAPASGWCPTQTEDLGGNASYTFQASQSTKLALNSNGQAVTERRSSPPARSTALRRVLVRVTAPGGTPLFPKGYAVVSLNSVNLRQQRDDHRIAGLERQHHAPRTPPR